MSMMIELDGRSRVTLPGKAHRRYPVHEEADDVLVLKAVDDVLVLKAVARSAVSPGMARLHGRKDPRFGLWDVGWASCQPAFSPRAIRRSCSRWALSPAERARSRPWSRSQISRSASRAVLGRCCKPPARAAAPDRVDQPPVPASTSYIAMDSGPMYSLTPRSSSQSGGAVSSGPR